ncbi:MAG: hypothetical protein AB1668_01450 [Nanoarchaeota archaeon]
MAKCTLKVSSLFSIAVVLAVLAVLVVGCQTKEEVGTGAAVKVVEPVRKQAVPAVVSPDVIFLAHEVKILGKEGFDNPWLKAKAGDKIIWTNFIPEQKDVVLTFQKDGTKQFINSNLITSDGGFWEHTFEEAGNYTYWAVDYGVKAKVIVE